MDISQLIEQCRAAPESVEFQQVMAVIDQHYDYMMKNIRLKKKQDLKLRVLLVHYILQKDKKFLLQKM